MNIEKLVNQYPNDMELGAKVRELYRKGVENMKSLREEMKDAKIYESPDGGETVYVRDWGQDIEGRVKL